jgi:hypothetical protein
VSIAVSVCLLLWTIVFRPGPIQGLGSGFWPDHRVARINFFKKSKRRHFSKKTKVNGLQLNFWPGRLVNLPDHTKFFFPLFFFNPTCFQSWIGSILDWSIKPDQFLKQCFRLGEIYYIIHQAVSQADHGVVFVCARQWLEDILVGLKLLAHIVLGLGEIKILAMPWAQKLFVMSCQIVWKLN